MKQLFLPILFLLSIEFSACTKQTDNFVYLRFENTLQTPVINARITQFLTSNQQAKEVNLLVGNISPNETTGYFGFSSLTCNYDIPVVLMTAQVNGTSFESSSRCGIGNTGLAPGYYTVQITDGLLLAIK